MITISLTSLLGFILPALMALGVAGWALIRHTATKAVEHAFNRDLESHKANLQKTGTLEIEKLKIDWSAELNRKNKLLDREFEALPIAWDKVQVAVGSLNKALDQIETANIMHPNPSVVEAIISKYDLPEPVRHDILNTHNSLERQNIFVRAIDWENIKLSRDKILDARYYVISAGILTDENTRNALVDITDLALAAVKQRIEIYRTPPSSGTHPQTDLIQKYFMNLHRLVGIAEARVRERLGTLTRVESAEI